MNNWNGIGRLTKDVELRYTPQGTAIATSTVAVDRDFTNGQGEREADFIPFIVWGKAAENCANFIGKGSLVGITGRIQTRKYQDNEGKMQYPWEVVAERVKFLDKRKENAENGPNNAGNGQTNTNTQTGNQGPQNGRQGAQIVNGRQPGTNPPFFNDPFANVGQPIDISDEELPF